MTISLQRANVDRIQAAIAAGKSKIDAVDTGLRPEVREERIAAIRKATIQNIEAIGNDIYKRQADALKSMLYWSQSAARRRAKFNSDPTIDAVQRTATIETLKRASTAELISYLEDAVHEKCLAKAELVRLEFSSRQDSQKFTRQFDEVFASVVDLQALAMQTELEQIAGLSEYAQVLIREFTSGRPDPAGRMSGARAAGLVPRSKPAS